MTGIDAARRKAAEWHILLHEEPDDTSLQAQFEVWRDEDVLNAAAWASIERTFDAIPTGSTFGTLPYVPALPPETESTPGEKAAGKEHMPHAYRHGSARHRHSGVGGEMQADPRRASAPADVPKQGRFRATRVLAGLAAACLALVMIVQAPDLFLRGTADYSTGTAKIRDVTLSDGSLVRLAPESAIAVDFSAERRSVRLLSGMAFFEVAPNTERPFEVGTDGLKATVLGTEFNVSRLGDVRSVAVHGGHVQVTGTGPAAFGPIDLHVGDWLQIGLKHDVVMGHAPSDLMGHWWAGRMTVRGETIASVTDRFRPWYSGKIIILDAALSQRTVTGVYDPSKPVEAMKALVSPFGGNVMSISPWLMIVTSG